MDTNKKLYKVDSGKISLLRLINAEIAKLLADPEAKMPVFAQEDIGFWFLPRKWDGFTVKTGDGQRTGNVMTSIGEADKLRIEGKTFYAFKNAVIGEKANKLLQNELQEWEEAAATIDFSSGNVHVVGPTKQAYLKDVIVWGTNYSTHLDEINKQLAEGDAGLFATELFSDRFGELEQGVYPPGRNIPVIKNDQISCSCVGAAFRGGMYGDIVAVEYVGHKVSVESILATIRMGKKFYFESGYTGIGQFPVRSFKSITKVIPDINMVNAYVVTNAATAGGFKFKDEYAYILLHEKPEDLAKALEEKFAQKIQECLPYPIRPEWTTPIFNEAKRLGYVEVLTTFGSFTAGYVLNLERDWQGMLQRMLTQKTIKVEATNG